MNRGSFAWVVTILKWALWIGLVLFGLQVLYTFSGGHRLIFPFLNPD